MLDLALGLLVFVLGAPPGSAEARSSAALTQRATSLFHQKKYEAACPLFQRVTELEQGRAAAWGDYGLCLARLGGHWTDAIAATYQAIGLSGSDAKLRKAAYYNLGKVLEKTFPSHIPGPTEEGTLAELEGALPSCEIFDAVPGCNQRAWGCFSDGVGLDGLARFARDPRTIAQKPWPVSNAYVDPETILDKDVLVLSGGALGAARSGFGACASAVACRIVWADACNGRVGYQCDITIQRPKDDSLTEGGEPVPCVIHSTETGELIIQ